MNDPSGAKQIVVGITGASGAPYSVRLIRCLVEGGADVHLIVTPHGKRLLHDELGLAEVTTAALLGTESGRVTIHPYRDVGAIPGPISSPSAAGPHMLLRLGAALIRDAGDVLELLGFERDGQGTLFDLEDMTSEEKVFAKILEKPCDRDTLIRKSKLNISQANAILSLMEIKGLIKEELGEVRKTF